MLEKIAHKIKSFKLRFSSVIIVTTVAIAGLSIAHVAHGVADPQLSRGQLPKLLSAKEYSRALEVIASLSPQEQLLLDIRFYRATSLAGTGQSREAIGAFKALIKDEPQYPEFYNNLAMLLVEEGKLLEAQQALEQGLRSRESYAMLYNNLTVVFETMARRSYAKALRINKDQSPVLIPLVELRDYELPEGEVPVLVAAIDEHTPLPVAEVLTSKAVIEVHKEVDVNASMMTPTDNNNSSNRLIERVLRRWIENWQSKDMVGYIDSYSPNFKSRAYSSRQAWERGRTERIKRVRKIDISIEKINIEPLSAERVQADFIMNYRSDRYSDRTKKRVVFKRIDGRWRIVRELTLKVLS